MNIFKAILLKLLSAFLFAILSVLVRFLGETYPVGQIVFFRSAFAILPVVIIYAWQRELAAAVRTMRLRGHAGRGAISVCGMFFNFSALARLPLVDATAIQFTAPLITVGMSAVLLKERVRMYRWSAVIVGFFGVLVMLAPHFDPAKHSAVDAAVTIGLVFAIISAFCNAGAVIQTRRLTETETTSSIVFYFSLICALAGLATWPLGWRTPTWIEFAALAGTGLSGGLAHILLTESYRWAPASLIAPFDYSSMLWAFVLGYLVFGEVPTMFVFIGAAVIAAAGLFVLWRERRLGLRRTRAPEGPQGGT